MKELLLAKISGLIQEKKSTVLTHMIQLQESLHAESKSSAGDKHETGRAMVQLEMEQAGKQIRDIETLEQQFSRISKFHPLQIGPGSLVQTDHSWFYLSVPLGKVQVEEQEVFCIGPEAPLAKLLIGKKNGDCICFASKEYQILAIY